MTLRNPALQTKQRSYPMMRCNHGKGWRSSAGVGRRMGDDVIVSPLQQPDDGAGCLDRRKLSF
jgi:hypothetical protein